MPDKKLYLIQFLATCPSNKAIAELCQQWGIDAVCLPLPPHHIDRIQTLSHIARCLLKEAQPIVRISEGLIE